MKPESLIQSKQMCNKGEHILFVILGNEVIMWSSMNADDAKMQQNANSTNNITQQEKLKVVVKK